ncbi:MAG: hypothetical protein KC503_04835 [Myxococcales bacterium]|nr:hypothetical protein [Myxococcales bacterium]
MSEWQFDQTLDQIYAAGLTSRWDDALAAVARPFHGRAVTLEVHDKKRGELLFLQSRGVDAASAAAYSDYYVGSCPRITHALDLGSGEIAYDYAFYCERDIDRSEFYQDFLGPMLGLRYFASVHLVSDDERFGVLSIQRDARAGHVSDEDVALLQRFAPHVQRALEISARLGGQQAQSEGLIETLSRIRIAVVLVDRSLQVTFMNAAAEQALARRGAIRQRAGTLRAADRRDDRRLRSALAAAVQKAAGEAVIVLGRPPGATATVSISGIPTQPLEYGLFDSTVSPPPAALVLFDVHDPDSASEALAQLGLTPAEARLAVALAQGETPAHYAERSGVSRNTIHTQLARARHKLGAHTQAQVVRAVLMALRPSISDDQR